MTETVRVTCAQCGTTFTVDARATAVETTFYCSQACKDRDDTSEAEQ